MFHEVDHFRDSDVRRPGASEGSGEARALVRYGLLYATIALGIPVPNLATRVYRLRTWRASTLTHWRAKAPGEHFRAHPMETPGVPDATL